MDLESSLSNDAILPKLRSNVIKRKGRGFSRNGLITVDSAGYGHHEEKREAESSIQKSVEGWVVFVTGVHEEAVEDDLLDRCSDFGTVKDLRMPLDHRTGYVKGYALVEYGSVSEAKAAIAGLSNAVFLDYTLHASFAFLKHVPRQSQVFVN